MAEEKKKLLKCIPRGPVPRTNRSLSYDMLPMNLRLGNEVTDFRTRCALSNIERQKLPPSQSFECYKQRYEPISGNIYEKVARNHYVTNLLTSKTMSKSGNSSTTHESRGDRKTTILRNYRGDINVYRGAGKEIAQDPMKNFMVDGAITKKIEGWNAVDTSTKNKTNLSMYKESKGVEYANDEHTSFYHSFPIKKIIILGVSIFILYKIVQMKQ